VSRWLELKRRVLHRKMFAQADLQRVEDLGGVPVIKATLFDDDVR
jgi:hypothetical protein